MEVGPSVAVIDIIGVLPDIAAENGLAALHEGVLAVERLHHDDLAILDRQHQPQPNCVTPA